MYDKIKFERVSMVKIVSNFTGLFSISLFGYKQGGRFAVHFYQDGTTRCVLEYGNVQEYCKPLREHVKLLDMFYNNQISNIETIA